jgi:hypothetical protein
LRTVFKRRRNNEREFRDLQTRKRTYADRSICAAGLQISTYDPRNPVRYKKRMQKLQILRTKTGCLLIQIYHK